MQNGRRCLPRARVRSIFRIDCQIYMISIIIPCYNYAHYLADAVASAIQQRQDGFPVDILVMDDGSTDETPRVAAGFGSVIRYIRQANAGLSATRNQGMRNAAHDLVVFLDADDVLLPGAVKVLWDAWRQDSQRLAVLAGREQVVDAHLNPKGPQAQREEGQIQEFSARDLVLRNRFAPAVLADRRVLLEIGGFESGLRASEDRDMWIRVAARHRVAKLDKIILWKRDHGSNMSRAAHQQTECIRQVIARAASNSDLALTSGDLRAAAAVCWYQSALMFAEAGQFGMAAWRMMRSIATAPWISSRQTVIPFLSRPRALTSLLVALIRKQLVSSSRNTTAICH
jgi:glycosyltransferase involved in cell wall biosynthesis